MAYDLHNEQNTGTTKPMQLSKLPADLSGSIEQWLQKALNLSESFGLQSISEEVKKLEERRKQPGFRLAFVGEFNRGKSTLINRLLNRQLLPVKVIPTTSTITYVAAGEPEKMVVHFKDAHLEIRPLEAASWNDLIASDDSQVDRLKNVFPDVHVTLNDAWLRDKDIGLVDTPGAGDINDYRTALISDVLSQSDATVMLVSAASPLSLTERVFLEQEVLGRHIPLILVVVSKLDTFANDQRFTLLQSIRERIKNISSQIPVISSYPLSADMTEEDALEEVRAQINTLGTQSERRLWRSRQLAEILADHISLMAQIGQKALSVAEADAATRDEERKRAQKERELAASKWEAIRLDLESRRLRVEQELRRILNGSAASLCAALYSSLDETPDPRSWWNKEFSLLLRRELILLTHTYESFLLEALAHDAKALREAVAEAFDIQLAQKANSPGFSLEPPLQMRDITLADIQLYRFLSLIGSSIGVVAGFLLLGPVGSAISVTVGLINDLIQGQRIEEQRQQIKIEVARCVDRTLEEYTRLLTQRIHTLYEEMELRMQQKQNAWQTAKETALAEISHSHTAELEWHDLIKASLALHREVTTILSQ